MSHWTQDDSSKKQLYAEAAKAHLKARDLLDRLDVNKLEDFTGTLVEAIAIIRGGELAQPATEPAPEQPALAPALPVAEIDGAALFDHSKALPEAAVNAWTTVETPRGFRWTVCLRAGLPPELAQMALSATTCAMLAFEEEAQANRWLPVANGRDQVMSYAPGPAVHAAPPATKPAAVPPTAPPGSNGSATFAASALVATVSEGKTYWKVRGGKYTTHGVTIWPEALAEAGFDADALNPMQKYDLTGWTAVMELKEDGKPKKVVKLEKAA